MGGAELQGHTTHNSTRAHMVRECRSVCIAAGASLLVAPASLLLPHWMPPAGGRRLPGGSEAQSGALCPPGPLLCMQSVAGWNQPKQKRERRGSELRAGRWPYRPLSTVTGGVLKRQRTAALGFESTAMPPSTVPRQTMNCRSPTPPITLTHSKLQMFVGLYVSVRNV